MPPILARRPNVYAASPLDRAAGRRVDAAWVAARLADPGSLFVPLWRNRNLVTGMEEARPEAVYVAAEAALPLRQDPERPWVFLGLLDQTAVFAIDLSGAEDPLPLLPGLPGGFVDLRSVGWGVANPEAAVLAHARGLLHWRARHRFCGVCGAPCEPQSAGHVMHCTGCSSDHFPRTDPAVIMLVTRGDRALLGHSQRFPRANMYSTLAGFVEPGESVEEAVRREVAEESSVAVGEVWYHSSQPWPFPGNIMLGCYGEGLTEEIVVETAELVDVRWFSRAEIADPAAHGFALPRGDSIARRLVDDWLAAD
ncbi:MAG: NAD(+) diphosphatase [Acetobacteraceae bacterium]